MPFVVRKGSGPRPFKIVNKDTGEVVGRSHSKSSAQASANARNAAGHGFKPTGKKRRSS